MSSHLLAALGPGTQLGSLSRFTPDYLAARKALHELLVFPHLDTITLGDVPDSTTNLFALVASGNSRLSDLTNINVDLARKVISYDTTLGTLLDSFTVQILVLTMQPVAKGYANQARANSETNQRFFSSFSNYVDVINKRITDLQVKLEHLDLQIQAQSEALAERNIIATLWDILKTLYNLSSSPEESDVQTAALLGVTVSSIFGSFKSLFEDRRRLEQILSGLRALRQQIGSLKTKFVALSKGLTVVITNSQDLLNVWDDVAARQEAVTGVMDMVPTVISNQIKSAWTRVAADAKEYADALTQTTSAWSMHAVRSTQFNANLKVPITTHEIRLHKMVAALGSSAVVSSTDTKSSSAQNHDEKIVEAVLGPPSYARKKLEELADSTANIIDQFNNILQMPFIDQILCTSPIDGSDSNLFVVVNYYREKYFKLQLDTLPVARDLQAYAILQQTLLPFVKRDDQANVAAGDIQLSVFLDNNTNLVSGYLEATTGLSKRSNQLKNDWDNAINLVKMKINECEQNIDKWEQNIDQQKQMAVLASLAASGAFIVFTAAAFLPGIGMLAALGRIGGMTVEEAIAAGKIPEVIKILNAALQNAKNTTPKLEALSKPMREFSQSLSKVSRIWSDIATALTTLDAFYIVINSDAGPTILEIVKPRVIHQWGVVQTDVQEYINAVAG